jgi:hypothetical protein
LLVLEEIRGLKTSTRAWNVSAALAATIAALPVKRQAFYAGLEDLHLDNAARLFKNARQVSKRIQFDAVVLNYLFSKSRSDLPRLEWLREVRYTMAIDAILRDFFRPAPIERLSPVMDQEALANVLKQTVSPKGVLVLAFHGSFPTLVRKFFDQFQGGLMIQKSGGGALAAKNDPGAALFISMRALLEGKHVFVAPDGPFGKVQRTIRVLDVECPVAGGAPFLGYETRCETVWLAAKRDENGFAPVAEWGPRRESGETAEQFEDRLFRFYSDRIEASLTGDPRNLAISGRWMHHLRHALTQQPA